METRTHVEHPQNGVNQHLPIFLNTKIALSIADIAKILFSLVTCFWVFHKVVSTVEQVVSTSEKVNHEIALQREELIAIRAAIQGQTGTLNTLSKEVKHSRN